MIRLISHYQADAKATQFELLEFSQILQADNEAPKFYYCWSFLILDLSLINKLILKLLSLNTVRVFFKSL